MSQLNVVAWPFRSSTNQARGRNLEERLMVAAPWMYRLLARGVQRLRPGSRARRLLLQRGLRSGWAAFSRRDSELLLVRYALDTEYVADAGLRALGYPSPEYGHDGWLRVIDATMGVFRGWELSPRAFIDLGDRVLVLGIQSAEGGLSGAPVGGEYAQLFDIRQGLCTRQRDFLDWDAALRAAGLQRDGVLRLDELLVTAPESR